MIKVAIVLACLLLIDIYLLLQLDKHEVAIAELLKKHPDMLIGGDEDE